MYYTIQAQFIKSTADKFYTRLTDESIKNQKPDGKEIIASMNRAKIDPNGVVRWSEQCFCAPASRPRASNRLRRPLLPHEH